MPPTTLRRWSLMTAYYLFISMLSLWLIVPSGSIRDVLNVWIILRNDDVQESQSYVACWDPQSQLNVH